MIERRFRRAIDELDPMFAFVSEFAAAERVPDSAAGDLALIAEELFTNCVKYGAKSGEVVIGLARDGARVTLRIVDAGAPPFDPTAAAPADVAAPIEARHAGGLGIHLVRKLAERMSYERLDGANVVTVVTRLEG